MTPRRAEVKNSNKIKKKSKNLKNLKKKLKYVTLQIRNTKYILKLIEVEQLQQPP